VEKAKFSAALISLAPNVLFQIPGSGGRELMNLKNYLSGLPIYVLFLGPDFQAPRIIRDLIGGLD
jgi:hypothetical protein